MKDQFADLDDDFKDAVANMTEEEIRTTVSKVALVTEAVIEARDLDQDLAEKKEQARVAGASYAEALKMNKLRIQFCRRVLGDKCKENGSFEKSS